MAGLVLFMVLPGVRWPDRASYKAPPLVEVSAAVTTRTFTIQAMLILVASATAFALQGGHAALAAAFGGAVVMVNSLLLIWHHRRAVTRAGQDIGKNMRIAFRCAFERLGATIALMAVGLGILKLSPLPLLGSFIFMIVASQVARVDETLLRQTHGKQ